ncbi:hypothetical protein U9M48_032780 [Paspalum notatum var. saurae]|uniref:Cathepsin propeptide inhibitor domain-containing protein n=1 Tax=Paspalum notatum var. saurae TaxID=547442 RepID=A0AAQ3U5S9_PASNO
MSLRALSSLLTLRFSQRGPRAQSQAHALRLASRSSSRYLHTLRDLDVGDGAFGALAVGGLAALFLYFKEDESARQATGAVPKREVNLYKDPAIRAKFTDQDGKVDWIQYLDYIVFRKKFPKATDEEILGMMTQMRYHHMTTSKQEDVKVDEPAMKARFEEWIKKYGRIYKSEEEKARRYEIFKVNAIEADRANTSSPRSGPPFAPNNLGDWSKEELSGLYMHQGDFDWESYFDELGRMYDETGTYHYTAKSDWENCSEPVKQCYMKQAAMAAEKAAAAGGRTMGDDGATLNSFRL